MIDSLVWSIVWAVLGYCAWSYLSNWQMEAYTAWGVQSYQEAYHSDHHNYAGFTTEGIILRYMFECIVVFIGGLISFGNLLDFLYDPTHVTEIDHSETGGKAVKWSLVSFPFSKEEESIVFNRILVIDRTQTTLQRLTGTETVVLTLLIMKGAVTETILMTIPGIALMTKEHTDAISEYVEDHDTHHVQMEK